MKQRFVLLAFALCSLLNASVAQQPDQWQEYFQSLLDDDDDLQTSIDEVYDLLSDLAATPRNINTASREDLEELPFLTPWQVESICEYIYKYGGMLTIDELAMIESLDSTRRGLLRCFFYAAPVEKDDRTPSLAEIFSRSRHELTLTAKVPFYKRQGDTDGYLGFPYRHSVRYTFSSMNRVKAGLTGAQDSGEPFFAGRNPLGYDHYSFYIQLMRLGRLKSLVAGRYKAKAGMGLVLNTDFAFGKQAALAALSRNQTTIRPSSSRSSANYLQGAAATVELAKGLDLTAIASWRLIDATLTKDQTAIQTILKTGYHRTESEMQRKNNAAMTALGAHLTFRRGGFNVGITALHTATSKPLQPNNGQLYRKHYPSGSRFWNASIDYSYRNHWLAVSGETATGSCRALATINTATATLSPKLSLTAVQRFYSYRYASLLAQSFADGGQVQNESGLYLGAEYRPGSHLTLTAYTDVARFPWPKYLADTTSHGYECMASATYRKGNLTMQMRYRLKIREKNNADHTALTADATHRGRLFAQLQAGRWLLKTQADVACNNYKKRSTGWMLSQTASWQPLRKLQTAATAAYFHTDDYASRIYTYERGPLYTMSFPSFYGHGFHLTLLLRADLSRRWMALAKLSATRYFDRSHISSGLQQIDSRQQTDLELQVRLRL